VAARPHGRSPAGLGQTHQPRSDGADAEVARIDPEAGRGQHNLLIRALYFVFVGWWASLIWANVANLLAITIVGLPIAIWMLHRLPFVLSLYRYDG
jgi:uncharacterized membrane protein YccF (DUF307 family)